MNIIPTLFRSIYPAIRGQ